ncbi:hypothetical protein EHQ23_13905 [Leptospira bourretii]|uniref:Uncharacterized protein n=1 Tax=Leptospira bourretii TaxID=2484962 RepID=A0A4R9IRE5_9LEPT|nr:hypothetical protein [Leptospira bourretii]TGK85721.1 hypothetical protein EHQ23_13905 [Leptospira bourretii]TGK94618.1 hypothetical protein EHQ26_01335 [Leptospira bourretii]TGL24975.1 hypothetical protein EHQ47_03265 [Leptospira bourretii]TGL38191.1 hypothetical protein EHQ45_05165 [Leptospira bourretii]
MRIDESPFSRMNVDLLKDRRVNYVGHGQLESAPESLSALHVISHELGHAAEFKNQAFREGREVQSVQVKINYELRDGRMVAVSGETHAVTRPHSQPEEDPALVPYSDGKSIKDLFQLKEDDDKKSKSAEKSKSDPKEIMRKSHEKDLESKIKELETRLETEKTKKSSDVHSEERLKEIESEKKRLEEEIRLIRVKEQLKETFALLTDFRKMMTSNLFGMMNLQTESNVGNYLDTFV